MLCDARRLQNIKSTRVQSQRFLSDSNSISLSPVMHKGFFRNTKIHFLKTHICRIYIWVPVTSCSCQMQSLSYKLFFLYSDILIILHNKIYLMLSIKHITVAVVFTEVKSTWTGTLISIAGGDIFLHCCNCKSMSGSG